MRFIELLTVVAVVATVANAAPTQVKREIMELDQPLDRKAFIFDPSKMERQAARRRKIHKKRATAKDCCGGGGFGLNLGGRLDLSAGAGGGAHFGAAEAAPAPAAPAVAPAPVAPAPAAPAAPVNRNDRNGDSVVVVVDAKHG